MSNAERRIYLLSRLDFSPETIAHVLAKTSRSPKPFDEIARGVYGSQKFHERWVVGFGHGSIAEHAVLHFALENVSRLAAEAIEGNRLCSYMEKSSRYQEFSTYYLPGELEGSALGRLYTEACEGLFAAYHRCLARLGADGSEDVHDVCRFLLPAAALANLGMTANARSLEWGITKLLSHPLSEVRAIGEQLKGVAREKLPTLVKYAQADPYLTGTAAVLQCCSAEVLQHLRIAAPPHRSSVQLSHYDRRAEEKFVAGCLYRYSALAWENLLLQAREMSQAEREELVEAALGRLGPRDRPPRELEHISYTFDCLLDQGAYRDLARHRMMTQTAQRPTVEHGYAVPRAIAEGGLRQEYEEAIGRATEAYRKIKPEYPHEAAYLVTNAHNRRVLMTLNLRELYHLVGLRTRKEGHFSYRRIAARMFELAREKHPLLLGYLPFAEEPPASAELEREYFAKV